MKRELADFTELSFEAVVAFREKINAGDATAVLDYLHSELLVDIPLSEQEKADIAKMVETLVSKHQS